MQYAKEDRLRWVATLDDVHFEVLEIQLRKLGTSNKQLFVGAHKPHCKGSQ